MAYVAVSNYRRRTAKRNAKASGLLQDGGVGGAVPPGKQGSDSGVCMDQEARQSKKN